MSDFELITTQSRLDSFCANAAKQPILLLDTEFIRTRTLRPKLGLIQAYDGTLAVLIDPLAELKLDVFWALLSNVNITKVLHSGSEDLEVFKCYATGLPEPLFDTQFAAAVLGDGSSLGYAALAKKYLDVHIDKGESRTDWLARPLSDKQLDYAAKDVLYLKPIFEQLQSRLNDKGCYDYVLQEGALAVTKRHIEIAVDDIYLGIKGAWRLGPRQLAILKALARWRQLEARQRDLALPFVLKEVSLITIATNKPQSLQALNVLPGVLPQEVRRHGNTILQLVQQALALPDEQLPAPIIRLENMPGYKPASKLIKQSIQTIAEQQALPPEVIASKRQINQLLSWWWITDASAQEAATKPDLLQGWRMTVVGQTLLTQLKALDQT